MKSNTGELYFKSYLLREKIIDVLQKNSVPLFFLVLSLMGFYFSGLSATFVTNQVITRFIRNGVLVLALIIPIKAGMGLNFAITLGALCTHAGIIIALNHSLEGVSGVLITLGSSILLALIAGYLIGLALNRARGKEMITSIIIGFLGNSIFQIIFMAGFGTVIPIKNKGIALSRGVGVRDMVDLSGFRRLLPGGLTPEFMGVDIPIPMIIIVVSLGSLIHYILSTPFGLKVKAVGESCKNSKLLGIDSDMVRIKAVIISTVFAAIGQFIYLQNIGIANVYSAQSNTDIFSSAAILAGGATMKNSSVKNAFLGIFLFHTLFIVSPQAGQNIFNNPALGEYFRSFIAYGTIAFAIVMNLKKSPHLS